MQYFLEKSSVNLHLLQKTYLPIFESSLQPILYNTKPQIMELMGSTVTQVVCGRRHLLCRVGDRILACGYGARGQLGCPHLALALVPTHVPFTLNGDSPVST